MKTESNWREYNPLRAGSLALMAAVRGVRPMERIGEFGRQRVFFPGGDLRSRCTIVFFGAVERFHGVQLGRRGAKKKSVRQTVGMQDICIVLISETPDLRFDERLPSFPKIGRAAKGAAEQQGLNAGGDEHGQVEARVSRNVGLMEMIPGRDDDYGPEGLR